MAQTKRSRTAAKRPAKPTTKAPAKPRDPNEDADGNPLPIAPVSPTGKRRGRPRTKLATTFRPKFWSEADGRGKMVRAIRARYADLCDDCNATNTQKKLLAQRAIFLAVQLDTWEREALEGNAVEMGQYTQATNALIGLLRALGMNTKRATDAADLAKYVEAKSV